MFNNALLSRRRFVRRFALGMATASILGKAKQNPFLWEVAGDTPPAGARLRVSLDDFPVLRNELGSLRLSVNPIGDDSFPNGNHYPIVITHAGGGVYFALSSACAHARCVVEAFDPFEQGLVCPCHGSLYAIDGTLLRGPATRGLTPYAAVYDGKGLLTVTVPDLAYGVTVSSLKAAAGPRLALTFPTWPNVTYEIRYRAELSDPGVPVAFSASLEGELDQYVWLGDDQPATVFVSPIGNRGFLEVGVILLDLG